MANYKKPYIDLTEESNINFSSSVNQNANRLSSRILPSSLTYKQMQERKQFYSTNVQQQNIPRQTIISTKLIPTFVPQSMNTSSSYYANPNLGALIVFTLINSKEFTIRLTGNANFQLLSTIRNTPGANFNIRRKRWEFPLRVHDTLHVALATLRVMVEPLPRSIISAAQLKDARDIQAQKQLADNQALGVESLLSLKGHIPDTVLYQLAPFQRDGVQFILKNNGRAILADEMGLGKTRTAIATATAFIDEWPVLVICPSSARHHWLDELQTMLIPSGIINKKDAHLIENANELTSKQSKIPKFNILSYNLMSKAHDYLQRIRFNVVIIDECHYMKNPNAQRTKLLIPTIQASKRAVLLSGTPALSRPIELFTQLHSLSPREWPDIKIFGKRYCRNEQNGKKNDGITLKLGNMNDGTTAVYNKSSLWSSDFKGARNLKELHILLMGTLMIRRLKKDVLSQLPKKVRKVVKVEIVDSTVKENLRLLLCLIANFQRNDQKRKKSSNVDIESFLVSDPNGLVEGETVATRRKNALMELYHKSGSAKLPSILKYIGSFLDDKMSGKILIFAHHKNVLNEITQYVKSRKVEMIRIDGSTSSKDRHVRVAHFQQNSLCRVAVLAITAAGIALTLTAAATVFFAEMFWTPGAMIQAEDRAHRIGQVSAVHVTYFLADGCVDDILWPLLRKKMKLLGEIVEGTNESDMIKNEEESGGIASSIANETDPEINSNVDELEDIVKEIVIDEMKDIQKNTDQLDKASSKKRKMNSTIDPKIISIEDDNDLDENSDFEIDQTINMGLLEEIESDVERIHQHNLQNGLQNETVPSKEDVSDMEDDGEPPDPLSLLYMQEGSKLENKSNSWVDYHPATNNHMYVPDVNNGQSKRREIIDIFDDDDDDDDDVDYGLNNVSTPIFASNQTKSMKLGPCNNKKSQLNNDCIESKEAADNYTSSLLNSLLDVLHDDSQDNNDDWIDSYLPESLLNNNSSVTEIKNNVSKPSTITEGTNVSLGGEHDQLLDTKATDNDQNVSVINQSVDLFKYKNDHGLLSSHRNKLPSFSSNKATTKRSFTPAIKSTTSSMSS